MTFTDYRLPDGTIVKCDASATKNAPVIDFTLKGGAIVQATIVRDAPDTLRFLERVAIEALEDLRGDVTRAATQAEAWRIWQALGRIEELAAELSTLALKRHNDLEDR